MVGNTIISLEPGDKVLYQENGKQFVGTAILIGANWFIRSEDGRRTIAFGSVKVLRVAHAGSTVVKHTLTPYSWTGQS